MSRAIAELFIDGSYNDLLTSNILSDKEITISVNDAVYSYISQCMNMYNSMKDIIENIDRLYQCYCDYCDYYNCDKVSKTQLIMVICAYKNPEFIK